MVSGGGGPVLLAPAVACPQAGRPVSGLGRGWEVSSAGRPGRGWTGQRLSWGQSRGCGPSQLLWPRAGPALQGQRGALCGFSRLGAPDFLPPSCLQPPPSPPRNLWELALLTRRFPRPAAPHPPPGVPLCTACLWATRPPGACDSGHRKLPLGRGDLWGGEETWRGLHRIHAAGSQPRTVVCTPAPHSHP